MSDIRKLQELVIAFRDDRDWKQFHDPKSMAISLSLEASELLEHFQWKNAEEVVLHISAHRDAVGAELADILYCVLLMASDLKIDISEAFIAKMKQNEAKYPVAKSRGNHKKYTEHLDTKA